MKELMSMNYEIKEVFDMVKTEETLKNSTKAFLTEKTLGYTKAKTADRKIYLRVAAVVCVMLLIIGGSGFYFTPTSEISIDINPSFVMSINRFDRVISVNGLNDDGKELTGALDVKFKNYADAVNLILENEKISSLLSDNEMTITVTGSDEAQSYKILSRVEECTAGHKNTHCYYSSADESAAAGNAGLSCGKYKLFLEANALDPDITPEMIQNMTMKEIRGLIDGLLAEKPGNTSSDSDNGHHGANIYGHKHR